MNVSVTTAHAKTLLQPSSISNRNCFDTNAFYDFQVNDKLTKIEVNLQALQKYTALSEIQLFTGRESGNFTEENIKEDSARTWILPEDSGELEFDVMHISGAAHLGISQKILSSGNMVITDVTGDHSGSIHIGSQQNMNMSTKKTIILPFNVQAYKVNIKKRHYMYRRR